MQCEAICSRAQVEGGRVVAAAELASASILNGLECQTALHDIFDPKAFRRAVKLPPPPALPSVIEQTDQRAGPTPKLIIRGPSRIRYLVS